MSLVNIIKEKAQQQGLSLAEVERKLGLGNSTIRKWDKNSPSLDKIIATANLLRLHPQELGFDCVEHDTELSEFIRKYNSLSQTDKNKIASFIDIASLPTVPDQKKSSDKSLQEESTEYKSIKKVPLLGKVAAGIPITLVEEYLDHVLAPSTKVNFATVAKGESMEPVIHNRETIFVQSMTALDNGNIGIFDIDGETTCKVFKYDCKNKTVILTSFNDAFNPLTYPLKKYQNTFRIVGKVILTDEQEERYHNFISK